MPQSATEKNWWSMTETCTHCGGDDTESDGRRMLVLCSSCFAGGTHAGCHEDVAGEALSPEITHGDGLYFCGKECQRSYEAIEAATGRRVRIRDEPEQYTFELVQYKNDDRAVRSAAETAMRMFRSSFAPLIMENGRDLLEMVCTSYETPDEEVDAEEGGGHNFSAFRLAVLRMGGTIITAATLRVFGSKFAEMPFVSTRQGHRRSGHCKRLMKAVEDLLLAGGVHCLVIPSINELLPMWTEKFNFGRLAPEEVEGIEDWIVDTDRDTCTLVKKYILPPGQPQPQRRQPRPLPMQQQATLPPPRPQGACSIKSSSPSAVSSGGAINAACNSAARAKALRKRGRAPKIVLSKSLRRDYGDSDEDSDNESSSGDSDENGGGGNKRGAGRPRGRSCGHRHSRRDVTQSGSESEFVPTMKANAGGDGDGSDSGTEDLVSETPMGRGSAAGKRARANMAATAAAESSKRKGGSKSNSAAAAEADGSAAATAKPKRTRRLGPRALRPAPEFLPAHPIYGHDVSAIKIPAELPPAPPPMPLEVDLARPGLPNKPFELSIHLQSFIVRKAEKAAAMAAAAVAGGGDATGGAGQPSACVAVAGTVAAASAATTTVAAVAAAPVGGAAAVVQPTPRHQFLPPQPPLQQPLPEQHPQQEKKRRRRKRARQSDGQQPQQQTRRHRGRRPPRSPAQEAARQRRLRILLAARQRRREYRELMMGFIVAEMVRLELRPEEGQRISEPMALMPLQNDPWDGELARLRSQYETLQRSHRALELQLAAAESALRQAQQKQLPEQVQLPLSLAAPTLDCFSEPMEPDLAGAIPLPVPEPEPNQACEAAAAPTPLAVRTLLLSCATTPAAVDHRRSRASPLPSAPSSSEPYAASAEELFDTAGEDRRNKRARNATGGPSEPLAVSPTSTPLASGLHASIVGAAAIGKPDSTTHAAGSPCADGDGKCSAHPRNGTSTSMSMVLDVDVLKRFAGGQEAEELAAAVPNEPSEHAEVVVMGLEVPMCEIETVALPTLVGPEGASHGFTAPAKPHVLVAAKTGTMGSATEAAASTSAIVSTSMPVAVDRLRERVGGSADKSDDGRGIAAAVNGHARQHNCSACAAAARVLQLNGRSPSGMLSAALGNVTCVAAVPRAEPVATRMDVVEESGQAGPVAAAEPLAEALTGCSHGLTVSDFGACGAVATPCGVGNSKESEVQKAGHKTTEEQRNAGITAIQKPEFSPGLRWGIPPGPMAKVASSLTLMATATMGDGVTATAASTASIPAIYPGTAATADGEMVTLPQPQPCTVLCSGGHADPSFKSPAGDSGICESGGESGERSPSTPPFSLAEVSRHIRQALFRSGALAGGSPPSPFAEALGAADGGRDAATDAVAVIRDDAEGGGGGTPDCVAGDQDDCAAVGNNGGGGVAQMHHAPAMLSLTALRLSTDIPHPRGWGPRTGGLLADRLTAASPPRRHDPWMGKDGGSGTAGACSPISGCLHNGTTMLRAVNLDRSTPFRAMQLSSDNDDDGTGGTSMSRSCSRKRRIIMLGMNNGNCSSSSVLKRQSPGSSTSPSGLTVTDALFGSRTEQIATAETAPDAVKSATALTGRHLGAAELAAVEQLSAMAATTTGCFAAVATAAAAAAAAVAATAVPSSPDAEGARPPRPPVHEPLAETGAELAAGERNPASASPLGFISYDKQTLPSGAGTGASSASPGGAAGGYEPDHSGRNAPSSFIASPVSLRRFELTCLNPLLPHVVAVLLADTPPSRSPSQLRDSGRRRRRCLAIADGIPGACGVVEGDADLSAGASKAEGKTTADGDDSGGGRPGMRAALWETFEACAGARAIAVQAEVGTADPYVAPPPEGEDGKCATFLSDAERMHVPAVLMMTRGVAAGSKSISSALPTPITDATDVTIDSAGANDFYLHDKTHPPPDEPDAAAAAAVVMDGAKRAPDSAPAIKVASTTETCEGRNNPAVAECGRLGPQALLGSQQPAQARGQSPIDSCASARNPYGRLVGGAPGVGPVLTVTRSSGSSNPALTKPRGRLVVLAPLNEPGSNSSRNHYATVVDPYEAVLDDDETAIVRGDHAPRRSTCTSLPVTSAPAAAVRPVTAVADKAADPESTPSSSGDTDTTRAATMGAAFSGSPSDAAARRRKARLTRRKKKALHLFGEDVVLTGSAPSDSPESTPPDSTPQTPRSDKQADGMDGLLTSPAADRVATAVGGQGLGLGPITKLAGTAAEGGCGDGTAAIASFWNAAGAVGCGAGASGGNITATASPCPAPQSHKGAAMITKEAESLGSGACSNPLAAARGQSVAHQGSKAAAGRSGIVGGAAVVHSPGTHSVMMAAPALELVAMDTITAATQRSGLEPEMAIQPRAMDANARPTEVATPRRPYRPNVAVGLSDGVEAAEAAGAEEPLTHEEVLVSLGGDGEHGRVSGGRCAIAARGGCGHTNSRGWGPSGFNYNHGSDGILASLVSSNAYLDESLRSSFRTMDIDLAADRYGEIVTSAHGSRNATTAAAFDSGGGNGEVSQASREQHPPGAAFARNNNALEPLRQNLCRYQLPTALLEPVSPPRQKQPMLMVPALQMEFHPSIAKGILAGPQGGSSFLEGLELLGSEGPTREDVDMAHENVSALVNMLAPND